jgi:hypothetical protein
MKYLLELTNDEQCYKEYPVQQVGIKSQNEQCMNENHSTRNGSCRSALTSVDTSLHSDTESEFRSNHSLFFLFAVACIGKKLQIPIL